MNEFEELCKLASEEKWCWNLTCTTCGYLHFRYSFLELAAGKSPNDSNWLIHWSTTSYSHSLGSLPRTFSGDQKEKINEICSKADLSAISSYCKFPDWLGYLGLILVHMHSDSDSFENLSRSWAAQLSKLVQTSSQIHNRLSEISRGDRLLNISDLEACEVGILRNKWSTIHPA